MKNSKLKLIKIANTLSMAPLVKKIFISRGYNTVARRYGLNV